LLSHFSSAEKVEPVSERLSVSWTNKTGRQAIKHYGGKSAGKKTLWRQVGRQKNTMAVKNKRKKAHPQSSTAGKKKARPPVAR
jgi:hypothetical protein